MQSGVGGTKWRTEVQSELQKERREKKEKQKERDRKKNEDWRKEEGKRQKKYNDKTFPGQKLNEKQKIDR